MTRETGSDRIRELTGAGELGQVPPDADLARTGAGGRRAALGNRGRGCG